MVEFYRRGCSIPEEWVQVGAVPFGIPPCVAAITEVLDNPCSLDQNRKCVSAVMRAANPVAARVVERPPAEAQAGICARCGGTGFREVERTVYGEKVKEFDDCDGCSGSGRKVTR